MACQEIFMGCTCNFCLGFGIVLFYMLFQRRQSFKLKVRCVPLPSECVNRLCLCLCLQQCLCLCLTKNLCISIEINTITPTCQQNVVYIIYLTYLHSKMLKKHIYKHEKCSQQCKFVISDVHCQF